VVRQFFAERDVVEVATTALSAYGTTDPALHNLSCEVAALGRRMYLQTSPEHAMKRLLAAGSGDIWQLARVFRDGELGRWHQPEFRLLEWYRLGFDEHALMDEVYELLCQCAALGKLRLDRKNLSYGEAFNERFRVDPYRLGADGRIRLTDALRNCAIDVPNELTDDALLDLALSSLVVRAWPDNTAVFLYAYPQSQAALAAINPGEPATAARFEVFVNGIELGNGFRELSDAREQQRRFESDLARRFAAGLESVPIDAELLAALARGLPDCAGVAIGFDRLLAFVAGSGDLAAAIDWPHARTEP
jgi:lysyl-tRNA synthetase class 2